MANEEQVQILRQGAEVWNQWQKENASVRNDLNGAYLSFAKLSNVLLRESHLSQVDLSYATLDSADLTLADISDANLSKTQLFRADLSDTDLTGSDLSDAFLGLANFNRAKLKDTDFSSAFFQGTVLANVDLSEAKGLESVRHGGPSSVGIDTIYRSKGQIPEIFLRGCGVPDIFIEYMHALTAKPFEFYSCFISYSHADAAFAQRLHDTLQGKGVRCWLDEKDARLGVPITHNIESGIRLTDKFLLCCSKEALSSGWVNLEIDMALHRETELRKAGEGAWRLIPLDLDGHLFSSKYSGEALRIRNRLAGDFTGWKTDSDKFDRQIARVMQAIRIESEGSVTK